MEGHRAADPRTLYVGVRNKDVFRIDMHGACLAGANMGDPLVVETVGGSDLVCRPIDLDLKVAGSIGLSPCIVKSITKLPPPQIASLRAAGADGKLLGTRTLMLNHATARGACSSVAASGPGFAYRLGVTCDCFTAITRRPGVILTQ